MSIETELLSIMGDSELLIVEDALDWASSHRNSELAKNLEWDDAKAGHEHRLNQMRKLIAVHVTFSGGERKMVSLTIDRVKPGGGYRDIDDVLRTRSLYDIMLSDALAELERLEKKYQHIKSLQPIWTAVRTARAKHGGKGKGKGKGGRDHHAGA